MKLLPVNNRVIVEPELKPEKSAGGIHIPESARNKSEVARVTALGPGTICEYGRARSIRPGDRVLCLRWSGHAVEHEDKKYVVLEDNDILCVEVDDDEANDALDNSLEAAVLSAKQKLGVAGSTGEAGISMDSALAQQQKPELCRV
jgi:chaperonin GroES